MPKFIPKTKIGFDEKSRLSLPDLPRKGLKIEKKMRDRKINKI